MNRRALKKEKMSNYDINSSNYDISNKRRGVIVYDRYVFSAGEKVLYILLYAAMISGVAYVFYQSIIALVFMIPLIPVLLKRKKAELALRRKKELNKQFKEVILSVSSNLKAGYSIENAFVEAYEDIAMMYGAHCLMAKELYAMIGGLRNNMILEDLLLDFAKRSDLDDVRDFAEIFRIAKRNGGDMNAIIRNTANSIADKIEVRREVDTLISSRKFEQKIMNVIPFFIIFYVGLTSKEFFESLYHNVIGIIVMTVCLLIYGMAVLLSERIMNIEV